MYICVLVYITIRYSSIIKEAKCYTYDIQYISIG